MITSYNKKKLNIGNNKVIDKTKICKLLSIMLDKLSVDMNFRYWSSVDITQETPSLNDRIGQTITDVIERNITRAIPSVLRSL